MQGTELAGCVEEAVEWGQGESYCLASLHVVRRKWGLEMGRRPDTLLVCFWAISISRCSCYFGTSSPLVPIWFFMACGLGEIPRATLYSLWLTYSLDQPK